MTTILRRFCIRKQPIAIQSQWLMGLPPISIHSPSINLQNNKADGCSQEFVTGSLISPRAPIYFKVSIEG
ncbi:hypothetical protein SLEP1_g44439 [Rubroshorea leprosula]|uniref:Uncharacterized protein n=1 Tax=Rubroshorea leprosula TaxID=152421 RepID=A0AAV5LG65_9ROSI|nr:hypothetical protein SLEP1_g44439 [Rubroshorea leprosula]